MIRLLPVLIVLALFSCKKEESSRRMVAAELHPEYFIFPDVIDTTAAFFLSIGYEFPPGRVNCTAGYANGLSASVTFPEEYTEGVFSLPSSEQYLIFSYSSDGVQYHCENCEIEIIEHDMDLDYFRLEVNGDMVDSTGLQMINVGPIEIAQFYD